MRKVLPLVIGFSFFIAAGATASAASPEADISGRWYMEGYCDDGYEWWGDVDVVQNGPRIALDWVSSGWTATGLTIGPIVFFKDYEDYCTYVGLARGDIVGIAQCRPNPPRTCNWTMVQGGGSAFDGGKGSAVSPPTPW